MFGNKKLTKKELANMENICKEEEGVFDLITFDEEPDLSNVVKTFDIFGGGIGGNGDTGTYKPNR